VRLSLRREGTHELPQERSLALVSFPQCLAAAEIANALHLRDFRSPAIFEFFNTIRQKRSEVGVRGRAGRASAANWLSSAGSLVRWVRALCTRFGAHLVLLLGLPRQRSLSGYHGSKASFFSRRSLTMFAAGFQRQLGAASVQCRCRSDASSFQIGVSGRRRTSLTAERSISEWVEHPRVLHLEVPT
jgi:hypothetical protein